MVLWVGRNKGRQPLGELHISSLRPSQQNLALFAPTVTRTVLFVELETHSEKREQENVSENIHHNWLGMHRSF